MYKENEGGGSVVVAHSETFQLLFAILLGCICLVRIVILIGGLIRYRKHEILRLAQPEVLALMVLSGTVAIASCYLLLETSNTSCYLKRVMIFLPLTLSGCILLGRVWRIVVLLTAPVIHHDGEGEWGVWLKSRLLRYLTTMADTSQDIAAFCNSFSGRFSCIRRNDEWKKQHQRVRKRKQRTNTSIKKQISTTQLLWLVLLLTLPQIILQVCILAIPALQEALHMQSQSMDAFLEDDGDEMTTVSLTASVCGNSRATQWTTYLSIALCVAPYILTVILSLNASDDLPKVFDETTAFIRSFKVFANVFVVAAPPILFLGGHQQPDTYVYLMSMLIFGVAIPPCWFVVYPKVWSAHTDVLKKKKDEQAKKAAAARAQEDAHNDSSSTESKSDYDISNKSLRTSTVTTTARALLRQKRSVKFLPNMKTGPENTKAAKLALTIGKMYEEMGLHQKSIDLFDEALAIWECDPNRRSKEKVGGYTKDEIESFTVVDLESICQLLIAKGRVEGTFKSHEKSGQNGAASSWLDALEIYELAPARAEIQDRSFLFPVFSGIFVFLKGGKIQQDENCTLEQNLTKKFVRETRLHGDPVHYTRALAMLSETKGRLGKYNVALESFGLLRDIYDPLEHSEKISAVYGTDRSAQAFSQAALWHMQLGNDTAAFKACDHVINNLLPAMDPTNILNMCEMLLPVIWVDKISKKHDPKRMRDLFDTYVVQNFETHMGKDGSTPCKPVFKPMLLLLEVSHDPENFDLVETVEWLIAEENAVMPDFLDSVYCKLCWSMHNLVAELCLRVAKCLFANNGNINDIQILVDKGLTLSKKAEKKLKNSKGKTKLTLPYRLHKPVFAELKDLAENLGISNFADEGSLSMSRNNSSLGIEGTNLPESYNLASTNGSSEDGSQTSSLPSTEPVRRLSGISLSALANFTADDSFREDPELGGLEKVKEEEVGLVLEDHDSGRMEDEKKTTS